MHEVTAAALVMDLRVGISRDALCLRLEGPSLVAMLAGGAASLAVVVAGTQVKVVPIERSWLGVDTIIEVAVPFDRLASASSPAEIQFGIQVRDSSDAVLETVPHGRCWSIAVPSMAPSPGDWQA